MGFGVLLCGFDLFHLFYWQLLVIQLCLAPLPLTIYDSRISTTIYLIHRPNVLCPHLAYDLIFFFPLIPFLLPPLTIEWQFPCFTELILSK